MSKNSLLCFTDGNMTTDHICCRVQCPMSNGHPKTISFISSVIIIRLTKDLLISKRPKLKMKLLFTFLTLTIGYKKQKSIGDQQIAFVRRYEIYDARLHLTFSHFPNKLLSRSSLQLLLSLLKILGLVPIQTQKAAAFA